jgi:hypothetical protein
VREEGDFFRIRPMYVGESAETSVVKSLDGRLLYFRSPWLDRKTTYLRAEHVGRDAWAAAATGFSPGPSNPGLEALASSILTVAQTKDDYAELKAGVLEAMVVAPQYVSSRVTADYWKLWEVDAAALSEEGQFERVIGNRALLVDGGVVALGVSDEEDPKYERFVAYLIVRASEGVLETMRCLARTVGRLEAGEGDRARASSEIQTCFSVPPVQEQNALEMLGLDDRFATVSKNLLASAGEWDFDALGRVMAIGGLTEAINELAESFASVADKDPETQTKRAAEAHIRLMWYSGNFRLAFQMTREAVLQHSSNDDVATRARLLEDLELDLLKALVYTGGDLASAREPQLRGAAAQASPRQSVFAVRANDVVLEPQSIDEIVYRLGEGAEGVNRSDTVGQVFDALTDTSQVDVDIDPVGIVTTRLPSGLRSIAWSGNGSGRGIALSEIIDERGQSMSAKLSTTAPVLATDLIQALRDGGFDLLEGRDLSAEFSKAVLFVFPAEDQIVALTERQGLRFGTSKDTPDFTEAVERALSAKGIHTNLIAEDAGIKSELERIVAQQIDSRVYFSGDSPFPGVLAYSQDASKLRVLLRTSDNALRSMSLENGQLVETATGKNAIRDINLYEAQVIAGRSDDQVRFMHVSAFDRSTDSTAHVQFGQVGADLPLVELDALVAGTGQPTPTLDALFSDPPIGVTPTVIIYRDAFVRGRLGGSGGYKPPGPGLALGAGSDPDRRPMQGTYQEDVEHAAPLELLLALKVKYRSYRFMLDDAVDVARANALDPVMVTSAADVAAYLPLSSFRVTHLGAVAGIASSLQDAGVAVENSMANLSRPNVLIISGHKDKALEQYVDAHVKAGNFRDKLVVLFSCYQAGDADLAHRAISEGGAREVIYFSQEISPAAVNIVMLEFARLLEELGETPDGRRRVLDVIDESIEAVLRRSDVPPERKEEIQKLRDSVPQLSYNEPGSDMTLRLVA